MISRIWLYPLVIMGVCLVLTSSCSKSGDTNDPTQSGTVTDIDGNVYHTVTIGTQVWMVENLKVTKYNDGTPIPLVTDINAWSKSSTPGYCWYNNDAATNKNVYGGLYNWFAVNTNKLCPIGWHVPSDVEWQILIRYIDPSATINVDNIGYESFTAGLKLKESGTTHWSSPNTGASNETGFTALPGGYRNNMAEFFSIGKACSWWSSKESTPGNFVYSWYGWYIYMKNNDSYVGGSNYDKIEGRSVRCIKD